MPQKTPAQAILDQAVDEIQSLHTAGIGCRVVAKNIGVSTVTLLNWYQKRFGKSWGYGSPTGRKRSVTDQMILEAARQHKFLHQAAEAVGLSQPGFVHAFKRTTGKTWRQFKQLHKPSLSDVKQRYATAINHSLKNPPRRLQLAKDLRREGLTLREVGIILGITESAACRLLQKDCA